MLTRWSQIQICSSHTCVQVPRAWPFIRQERLKRWMAASLSYQREWFLEAYVWTLHETVTLLTTWKGSSVNFMMLNLQPKYSRIILTVLLGTVVHREVILSPGTLKGGARKISCHLWNRYDLSLYPYLTIDQPSTQLENYPGEGNADLHGYKGPIHISGSPFDVSNFEKELLRAAEHQGYNKIKDLQGIRRSENSEMFCLAE